MKKYSKLNEIPNGTASYDITEGCLVLEGGALRGLYTQGVLDALMEENINFRTTIGVSAGALSGANYVSGQIGRSARLNLGYRRDPNFIGYKAAIKAKSLINLDYCIYDYSKIEPFDLERFQDPRRTFIAVATDCNTGKPKLFFNTDDNILEGIKASSTVPYISRNLIIDNIPYLDGGCSVCIPYRFAIDHNFKKIVVIKTRDRKFRNKDSVSRIPLAMYRNYPVLANLLANTRKNYNKECDEIDELEKKGKIFVIAPKEVVNVGRVERDMEKLGNLYFEGYKQGKEIIEDLKAYLAK